MTTKAELEFAVQAARGALAGAELALAEFDSSPDNNVFATVGEAESKLEDRLRDQAFNDCEGAHNCGADEYKQEFIVDGKHYLFTASFEYDRHDKMYYYIDGEEYTTTEVTEKVTP